MTSEREDGILTRLRPEYEAQGYRFRARPSQREIPSFLLDIVPDAIARRGDEGVVIEIKADTPEAPRLSRIASLVARQPGWNLVVVQSTTRPADAIRIAAPDLDLITSFIERIATLRRTGDRQLAFLSAWIALEALARYIAHQDGGRHDRILTPVQVVQRLVSSGDLDDAAAARLRGLAGLRSRFAHGDLEVAIEAADLDFTIEQVLLLYRRASAGR